MKHVIIIGGGITGLAAAHQLQKQAQAEDIPLSYTLIESDDRVGGKIKTEYPDGFVIDGGPDCFLSRKPWAIQMCRELGLEDELMGTNDDNRKTFVLNQGKLTPLPDGVLLIIPTKMAPFAASRLISWPGKIRMGMDLFIPPKKDDSDETVGSFVRRRLGQEALDKIAEPLMSGIHISDPERQSLLGSFPRFREMEKKHGSLIRSMLAQRKASAAHKSSSNGSKPLSMFMTLKKGLGQFVKAIEDSLTGDVVTGKQVTKVERISGMNGTGEQPRYRVRTAQGDVYEGDAVIMATPSYTAASMIEELLPNLATALNRIRYVTTATVSLGFRYEDIGSQFGGFGFVVPRKEYRKITGCTWTSTKFNHRTTEDTLLLRCFIGGPGHEHLAEKEDGELVKMVRQELRSIMGLHANPILTRIFRWNRANPQYDVGHLDRVAEMKEMAKEQPGILLAGSAYDGVGVPDCVRQGQEAADEIIELLQKQESPVESEESKVVGA